MNRYRGSLYLSAASVVWGGMCVVGKYTTTSIPPLTLVFLRFIVACLALGILVHRRGWKTLSREDIPQAVGIGVIGCTISIGTQFMGIHWSSAHMAAILTATTPIFIAILAPMFLKEKVKVKAMISLVIAASGMMMTTIPHTQNDGSVMGKILLIIAAATWGLYSILGKPLNKKGSLFILLGVALSLTEFSTPKYSFKLNLVRTRHR